MFYLINKLNILAVANTAEGLCGKVREFFHENGSKSYVFYYEKEEFLSVLELISENLEMTVSEYCAKNKINYDMLMQQNAGIIESYLADQNVCKIMLVDKEDDAIAKALDVSVQFLTKRTQNSLRVTCSDNLKDMDLYKYIEMDDILKTLFDTYGKFPNLPLCKKIH